MPGAEAFDQQPAVDRQVAGPRPSDGSQRAVRSGRRTAGGANAGRRERHNTEALQPADGPVQRSGRSAVSRAANGSGQRPLPQLEVVSDQGAALTMLNPARLNVLRALTEPDSAAGLARRLGLPRQRVNYHLRQLEAAGLVELVEERRKGNCTERVVRATARRYVVDPAVLGQQDEEPDGDRRSATYLVSVLARGVRELARLRRLAGARGKQLPTLTLDTEVAFGSSAAQARFAEDLLTAVNEVIARHHDETSPRRRRFRLVVGSYPVPPAER